MQSQKHDVTVALQDVASGDSNASERLWELTYEELRLIAERQLRGERVGHTLSATALVHEAYLRLVDESSVPWQNRRHFYAMAARACRRVLVDHARKRLAQKRGSQWIRITLRDDAAVDRESEEVIALNDALERLEHVDPVLSQIVEYRYFGGFTERETADLLEVSDRTVRRGWVKAKGWLYQELHETPAEGERP